MITEPKITLLAVTTLIHDDIEVDGDGEVTITGGPFDQLPIQEGVEEVHSADYLAEFAGRACYQSWDRPNAKTASTPDYLANILKTQHYSVLAHGSASFYIEGVSRSLTLELIRSRFLAFSQLSQRYVASGDMDWVCPPLALDDEYVQDLMEQNFRANVSRYEHLSALLQVKAEAEGITGTLAKKRAREAARAVLPNDTETKLVVSGNYRAWRDFIAQRWTVHADLEIQRLAGLLLTELIAIAPATFADFNPDTPGA